MLHALARIATAGGKSSATNLDQVDLIERFVISRLLNVEDRNNVLMIEVSEELHFTQGPEAKHGVVEGGNLLDGDFLAGGLVDCGASKSVEFSQKTFFDQTQAHNAIHWDAI